MRRAVAAGLILGVALTAAPAEARAPRPCLQAIRAAERVETLAGRGFVNVADAFDAQAVGDTARLAVLAAELDAMRPQVRAARATFRAAARRCRQS